MFEHIEQERKRRENLVARRPYWYAAAEFERRTLPTCVRLELWHKWIKFTRTVKPHPALYECEPGSPEWKAVYDPYMKIASDGYEAAQKLGFTEGLKPSEGRSYWTIFDVHNAHFYSAW